jgi:hypothetical protein
VTEDRRVIPVERKDLLDFKCSSLSKLHPSNTNMIFVFALAE